MEKFKEMALLLDIYGELLTPKQKDVMDQYYNFDLSLQEIAENVGNSKQGVHDLIRRAENTLVKTNNKLGLINRLSIIQTGLEEIQHILENLHSENVFTDYLSKGWNKNSEEQPSNILEVCLEKIEKLINSCLGG